MGQEIKIPDKVKKRLDDVKNKLESFKKQILARFKREIVGIALLPRISEKTFSFQEERDGSSVGKKGLDVFLLLRDVENVKRRFEVIKNISDGANKIVSGIDKNLGVRVMLLSELREACFDGKYVLLRMIAMSFVLYDPNDILKAIKVAEVHKDMVIKKFERYIVSYVAAGSLFRGEKANDIDVYVVVDDTDVKRMSRVELKDKLGAIIRGLGFEACAITGVKKIFHVQVYILTDFWESVKDAHPVIFTFLRDGVPLYDKGVFMPWKLLLNMGRIRPSREAIEINMNMGEKLLERVKFKLLSAVAEDLYYAALNPSQAALMLYGVNPPTPKETVDLLDGIFVKKEKLLEKKYVDILDKIRRMYKDIEHKKIKEIKGKEIDELIEEIKAYLKRIKKLFDQIERRKEKEGLIEIYEDCVSVTKDVLKLKKEVSDNFLIRRLGEVVKDGKLPRRILNDFKNVVKAKREYSKLTKEEIEKVKREARMFINSMVEFVQRARGRELERCRVRFKYGDVFGEMYLFDKVAFIISDVDAKEKEVSKADVVGDGLVDVRESSLDELEKFLSKAKIPKSVFIREKIFENLRELFGKDVEILI